MRISDWSSDVCASRRPRPLLVAILRSLGEYRKAVGDQLHRVAPALSRVVVVLAHAARDMHQVALLGFAAALVQLAEQRHLVPMGVRHPPPTPLAVEVRAAVHLRPTFPLSA